jgi:hypothetical protein
MIREAEPRPDCPHCDALPEKIAGSGRLHLCLASRHSVKKLRVYLSRDPRRTYEDTEDGHVLICVDEGGWGSLLADLSGLFSSSTLEDAKALCGSGFDEPTLLPPRGGVRAPFGRLVCALRRLRDAAGTDDPQERSRASQVFLAAARDLGDAVVGEKGTGCS